MLDRPQELNRIRGLLERHPVVALIGARQVGKTTIARMLADQYPAPATFFDLEDPRDLAKLNDPMLALQDLNGLVVIDEVQRIPDLYPVLRVLADRRDSPARFLVLGSAGPDLLKQTSETLAGRIIYHQMNGLALDEVGRDAADKLWVRGGFPRSFLADTDAEAYEWRAGFIKTFLERDIPQLGSRIPSTTLHRFWRMLAHYHGQVWNASEFARSFGVADSTVRGYLDLLTSALVIRQLPPWYENVGKRQVKSPKFYIIDSGLIHALLNLRTMDDILGHPKLGASWEGFVLQTLQRHLQAQPEECFFWASHGGAELDFLVVRGNRRLGFEIKRTSAPKVTASMRSAMSTLELERLDVVHAGPDTFSLTENIRAVAFSELFEQVSPLTVAGLSNFITTVRLT